MLLWKNTSFCLMVIQLRRKLGNESMSQHWAVRLHSFNNESAVESLSATYVGVDCRRRQQIAYQCLTKFLFTSLSLSHFCFSNVLKKFKSTFCYFTLQIETPYRIYHKKNSSELDWFRRKVRLKILPMVEEKNANWYTNKNDNKCFFKVIVPLVHSVVKLFTARSKHPKSLSIQQ